MNTEQTLQPSQTDDTLLRGTPRELYGTPQALAKDASLPLLERRRLLRQWEIDEQLRLIAASENMQGGPDNQLQEVRQGLRSLAASTQKSNSTAKQDAIHSVTVGVDLSDEQQDLLHFASKLAGSISANLRVVHASNATMAMASPSGLTMPLLPASVTHGLHAILRENITNSVEAALGENGTAEVHVSTGGAANALLEESGPDNVIVVGHETRGTVKRAIVGSVATRVVRSADGPVLVVPKDAQWPLQNILLCDDFSDSSLRIAETLSRLGLLKGRSIHVVYAIEDSLEPIFEQADGIANALQRRREAIETGYQNMLKKRLDNEYGKYPGWWSAKVCRGAKASEALLEYAQTANIDLIAVGANGQNAVARWLLGNATETLLHSAEVPLLVSA